MPDRPRIYFARHGETDWNAQGRLQGLKDTSLNAAGRRQADVLGGVLKAVLENDERLGIGREPQFLASPLTRARETMERMRLAMGLLPGGYRIDERLSEMSFGRWEGLTWKEIRRLHQADYREREKDRWHYVPDGGESYASVTVRVRHLLDELDGGALIVSHGGVARALITLVGGATRAEALRFPVWHGRVLVLEGRRFFWTSSSSRGSAATPTPP